MEDVSMQKIVFEQNGVRAEFLPSGDLYELSSHGIMINQLNGNVLDGSVNQVYLRVFIDNELFSAPLIGSNSSSTFSKSDNGLCWQGVFKEVTYHVYFQLAENGIWFWRIELSGNQQQVDVLYGQDLGNAAKGAVQANEAYISQYVDHKVTKTEQGYVVTSRQNQPQAGQFPVVEQGSLTPTSSFSTDGYQFFGTIYKLTNQPQALSQTSLANEVYQYEFAYIALQATPLQLRKEATTELVFYGATKANQVTAVEAPLFTKEEIQATYDSLKLPDFVPVATNGPKRIGEPLTGATFNEVEIEALFPERTLEEVENNQLLSFFTKKHHHVVLQEKERVMERAHGHILLSGTDLTVANPLMSTTLYMYGIFNSQIVLGNTSMNKLMSNSRNSLNIMKQSGQRIYVKVNEQWRLLTMPSAFEMGLNSGTWYYKLADDVLMVRTFTVADTREIRTEIQSQTGQKYTLAITQHLLMNESEVPSEQIQQTQTGLVVTASKESVISQEYPELTYSFDLNQPFQVTDESLFGIKNDQPELVVLVLEAQSEVTVRIQGSLTGAKIEPLITEYAKEDQCYETFIDNLLNNFQLEHPQAEVASMNTLTRWYAHNMLVHYLSPHGLEQYGGAAWGTRDVSQGPTEFFFAVNQPAIVGEIIKKVYANQFADDGNWPQWFMFDRYETVKADESHGDVIVWPMKVVADYLEKTNDTALLAVEIPYTDRQTFHKTVATATLFEHLKKEIMYIEEHFLAGTYLSCYGDGDWDDTLQPYDSKLKQNMASSWTVALTYQVMTKLSKVLATVDEEYSQHLAQLAQHIKQDFERYMLGTDVIPGFVYMEEEHEPELMIHPTDKKTGIQYRLLPMTRSMIAELLTPEQAAHHLAIIKENLQFPDGVRLMNRPANYQGGVSTNFKRAEQSANFGREIGLQYVHAHIRFTEAMAKLGKAEETWQALETINPIQIKTHVPNAQLRQANVYFSSSDGDFKTRYESKANFDKLKDGSVGVKGGWRIYSSGPGIYLNQLISNVLGIRENYNQVILDPVLPVTLDGLKMTYQVMNQPVQFIFHLQSEQKKVVVNGHELTVTSEENPYRQGGMILQKDQLVPLLKETNRIEIYC